MVQSAQCVSPKLRTILLERERRSECVPGIILRCELSSANQEFRKCGNRNKSAIRRKADLAGIERSAGAKGAPLGGGVCGKAASRKIVRDAKGASSSGCVKRRNRNPRSGPPHSKETQANRGLGLRPPEAGKLRRTRTPKKAEAKASESLKDTIPRYKYNDAGRWNKSFQRRQDAA